MSKTRFQRIGNAGDDTLTQPADSSSSWKLTIDGGGSLDLGTSFSDGDFGLHRQDAPAAVPTTVTIEGDKAPKEFTANFSGPINTASHGPGWHNPRITVTAEHTDPDDPSKTIVDSYKVTYNTKDALGNYDTDGAAPERDDTLNGHATQADYIQSGGGADVIDAKGGQDRIQSGSGGWAGENDYIEGGSGRDWGAENRRWRTAAGAGGTTGLWILRMEEKMKGKKKRNDSDTFGTFCNPVETWKVGAGDTATNKAWRAGA